MSFNFYDTIAIAALTVPCVALFNTCNSYDLRKFICDPLCLRVFVVQIKMHKEPKVERSVATSVEQRCERRFKKKFIFHFLDLIRQYNTNAFVVGSDKNTDCPFKYFKSAIFARPNGVVLMVHLLVFTRADLTHKNSPKINAHR